MSDPLMRPPELTTGECLFLMRLRARGSQVDFAKRFGVSVETYVKWELGLFTRLPSTVKTIKLVPKDHEACLIYRRRWSQKKGKKLSQAALADQMNCSRVWVNAMECGRVDCTQLRDFWAHQIKKLKL